VNVTGQVHRPFIRIDQHRLKPPLEEVAAAIVPSVKPSGISCRQPLNRPAQITFHRLHKKVKVIGHEHIG
jgi:hypothetical protein